MLAFCCSAALHRPCSVRFAWCLPKDRTTEMLNAAKRQPHRRRRQRHHPSLWATSQVLSLIIDWVSIRFDSLGCVRTPQSRFVRISICPASSPDGDSLWRYVLFFFAFCWIDMLAMFVDQPGANCPHQLLIAAVQACVRYPVSVSVSVDIYICVCKWLAT